MNGALIALIVMVVLMTWFLLVVRNEAAKLSKGKKKNDTCIRFPRSCPTHRGISIWYLAL